jgi:hypothetical protein
VCLPTQVAAAVAAEIAVCAAACEGGSSSSSSSSVMAQQLQRCLSSMATRQLHELRARGNR